MNTSSSEGSMVRMPRTLRPASANAACASALPVDKDKLRAAIEFEFDLPYPDGTRMDLVKSAMDSFSKRLQTSL